MLINEARNLNLTRKHFTLIAEIIGQVHDKANREELVFDIGGLLMASNPRFDGDRFASKVEEVHADCWADDGPIFEKGV
jgi:hypothetical protein